MAKKKLAEQLRELLGLSKSQPSPRTRQYKQETPASSRSSGGQGTPAGGAPRPPWPAPAPPEPNPGGPKSRIEWVEASKPKPAPPQAAAPPGSGKIDWGGAGGSGQLDPAALVGVEDAFDHTPLLPGEQVAFCTRDKIAYHLETWRFLLSQNQGRCCICGQSNVVRMVTLPGTPAVLPAPVDIPRPEVVVRPGERVISLKEVPDHINLAVIVQDYVYETYCTKSTGAYFVRFEPREIGEPVFSGFKVVIFSNYVSNWTNAGLSINSYAHRYIRVRGVVQQHPKWGIEILVNSPRMIEIVSEQK